MEQSNLPQDEENIPDYTMDEMGISQTREGIEDELNPMELELYEDWRMEFAQWAYHMGRDPYFIEGYSKKSMYNIMNRVEKFAEVVFREVGFTTDFSTEHLDAYWDVLRHNDNKLNTNRREINNASLVLKHKEVEYEIPESQRVYRKINKNTANGFEDYFSTPELEAVKTAALRVFTLDRDGVTADELETLAADLAQRIGKPKSELTESDWDDTMSFKIPSMVYACRDVGFRPSEVNESKMSWLRIDDDDDARFQIPQDEDSKDGKDNWRCYLSRESARLLRMWKEERKTKDKYDDRDAIWLNENGNRYYSKTLRDMMKKLMDEAEIDRTNREQGWYMIRRGVGTEIANSEGLSAVMSQLRIKRIETARRYVQTDEPSIREWMDTR